MNSEKSKRIKQYVYSKTQELLRPGESKATLAVLRRGIGLKPGELPALWGIIFDGFPEDMMQYPGRSGASREEWAVYSALTNFALHQQGHDPVTEPMHRELERLGISMRKLAVRNGIEDADTLDRVRRRFNVFATSSDMQELAHHLRGIVQMLRQSGIPLDYASLAADLYWYQDINHVADVRLSWGQDFYRKVDNYIEQEGYENEKE